MTVVNKEKLRVDLERKLGREPHCPLCGAENLMIGDNILELDLHVPLNENRKDFTTEALAVAVTSCIACGHVMLFNTHLVDS